MTSKELNLKLLKAFPELEDIYKEEVEWQEGDDTGSHVVFGDVLTPYLLEKINTGNAAIMKKIFDFLEELLISDDEYASEVITCSILESIIMDDINIDFVESFLGEKSMETWQDLKDDM